MGAATAYYLRLFDQSVSVAVIERDPTYRQSSTVLSDGNVRIQFNLVENIQMSLFAFEAIEDFPQRMAVGEWHPEPSPRHQGNLFLTDRAGEGAAREGMRRHDGIRQGEAEGAGGREAAAPSRQDEAHRVPPKPGSPADP